MSNMLPDMVKLRTDHFKRMQSHVEGAALTLALLAKVKSGVYDSVMARAMSGRNVVYDLNSIEQLAALPDDEVETMFMEYLASVAHILTVSYAATENGIAFDEIHQSVQDDES